FQLCRFHRCTLEYISDGNEFHTPSSPGSSGDLSQ
ncbi:uncharacterized, partial [Tachysurus ichikawai]